MYTRVWERGGSLLTVEFNNDKYIKTKIKSYGDKAHTDFWRQKMSKEKVSYECLRLIMLDSVIKLNKKSYPPILLEQSKYEKKIK